mgnify:FL=1
MIKANQFIYFIAFFLLLITKADLVLAQQPGIHFEAIARDRNNNPAKDRRIYIKATILQGAAAGSPVFIEEHRSRTNSEGIFQIVIGNGTRVGGAYASILNIPWRTLNYSLKIQVAIEPIVNVVNWNYQNEWIDLGASPFGLVPYAGTALMAEQVAASAAVLSFSGGTTGLSPITASQGNVVLGGILGIANGGTGSSVKNFVDLSTQQQVGGEKSFLQSLQANAGIMVAGSLSLQGNSTPFLIDNQSGSSGDVLVSRGAGFSPQWVSAQSVLGIKSKSRSVVLTAAEVFFIPVNGLDSNDGISVLMEVDAVPRPIPNYYIYRDIPNNRVEVHFTAPFTGFVTWVIVD